MLDEVVGVRNLTVGLLGHKFPLLFFLMDSCKENVLNF